MSRKRILLIWVALGVVAAISVWLLLRPGPQVRYEVVFLPDVNGVPVIPSAINDRGQIIGLAHVGAHQGRLYLWDPNAGLCDLGQGVVSGSLGHLQINNAGQIAWDVRDPNGSYYVFVRDPDGVRHTVHPPNGGEIHVLDLNSHGRIVGYLWSGGGGRQGFIWDKTAGMQSLPLQAAESMATGINDLGQIVGSRSERLMSGRWDAFLWDPNTGVQDLGTPGSHPASMCCINEQGFIVGRFDDSVLSVRTREGPWRRLCPDKKAVVQIEGLNEANRFVACTHRQRFIPRELEKRTVIDSYLWDPEAGFTDLETCLGRTDVHEFFATDLNNEGQISGSLRLKKRSNPCGVLLRPIPAQGK